MQGNTKKNIENMKDSYVDNKHDESIMSELNMSLMNTFDKNNDTNKLNENIIVDDQEMDETKLPFVERFRPKSLNDVMSHTETITTLNKFIKIHNIPHLLFYGPPGTGKTSTIEAFVNELYGDNYVDYMTMKINASEERGIEIVRNKIKNFVSTSPIKYNKDPKYPKYKFIILDEADAMTFDAQNMLKQVIEVFTYNARFCLICNCNKKIIPAIQSRCAVFNFPPLDYESVKKKISFISKNFDFIVTDDGIETIWKLSNGDMRKVMHMLQVLSNVSNKINSLTITDFYKYPSTKQMDDLFSVLIKGNLIKSMKYMTNMVSLHKFSLSDIIVELTHKINEAIINKNIDDIKGCDLLLNLRDIEMNAQVTTETDLQWTSIVGIFSL
jgi:replication factor C subunit 3/5